MNVQKLPTIVDIQTAFPERVIDQRTIFKDLLSKWYADIPNAEKIFEQSRVNKRHYAWDPREGFQNGSPGTGDRMKNYVPLAFELAAQSIRPMLERHDRNAIGSFVMASCTGYAGPTPDLLLAKLFELNPTIRRTFVGHMGCYAAFNVLKVALDSLAARPNERVLANCTELSSIHFRPVPTAEQAVIHALFGDASASLILSNEMPGAGPQILRTHTEQIFQTSDMMTWDIENDGFYMTLSPFVPLILNENIDHFMQKLLGPAGLRTSDIKHWGIHPGGPKIVDMLAQRLRLTDSQLRASWSVLAERGNCSSSTVLLVLKEILDHDCPTPNDYGVIVAFGPGLTMESALIRF